MAIMAGIQNYYSSPQLLRCGLKEPRVHRSRNLNDMSGYQKFLRVCLKYGASRLSSHLYMPQCILINGLLIHRSRQYDLYSFSEELDLNLSLATNNNNNNDASGMAESQLREEVPLNTELGTTKMVDETTTQTLTTSHLTQLSTDFLFGAIDTNAQQDIKASLRNLFLLSQGCFQHRMMPPPFRHLTCLNTCCRRTFIIRNLKEICFSRLLLSLPSLLMLILFNKVGIY